MSAVPSLLVVGAVQVTVAVPLATGDATVIENPARAVVALPSDTEMMMLELVPTFELVGVPVETVRAAFHYVRSGETVEPDELSDRPGLEALLR